MKQHIIAAVIINYALYLPAVVSVYNYLSNKELFDDLILQSKPLPIEFGYGILHIQFSILLACGILYGLFVLIRLDKNSQQGLLFYGLIGLVFCNFIFIHILSARTGLLGLYAGIAIFCISLLATMPFKTTRWLLLAIFVVPVLMVLFSSSLKNRIVNTYADLRVVVENKDANDYSFAMRVKAWQNAVSVIKEHPMLGVGLGDAELILFNNFQKVDHKLAPENRKNPHFQFLETAVQSGLICAFLFLLIAVLGCLKSNGRRNFVLIGFIALLYTASCFESILESQSNVIPFVFFIAIGLAFPPKGIETHH
ncbi:MAG: O-antigen ligase family protein [bacterium]|nr:O-antigen ligase family protein [bacterium]